MIWGFEMSFAWNKLKGLISAWSIVHLYSIGPKGYLMSGAGVNLAVKKLSSKCVAVSRHVSEPKPAKDFWVVSHIAKHTSHLFTVWHCCWLTSCSVNCFVATSHPWNLAEVLIPRTVSYSSKAFSGGAWGSSNVKRLPWMPQWFEGLAACTYCDKSRQWAPTLVGRSKS